MTRCAARPCRNEATHRIGEGITATWYCRACVRAVVEEYRSKLGWELTVHAPPDDVEGLPLFGEGE
jgi:hypothetical protein